MTDAETLAEGAGNGVWKGTGVSETAEPPSPSEAIIVRRMQARMEITQQLLQQASLCLKVAERLIAAFTAGNKALLCSNGESAAISNTSQPSLLASSISATLPCQRRR